MTDPHPTNPQEYREWVRQLEQKWLAGLIPDPQTVAIIVLNEQRGVLLQLRDDNPDVSSPKFWTLPGGVVESDETPEQAAQRELMEETGLRLEILEWKVYKRKSKNFKPTIEQYIYTAKTQREVSEMILGEGEALQFFRRDELPSLSIAFGFDKLLYEFFDQRKEAG